MSDALIRRRSLPPGGRVVTLAGGGDGWPLRAMTWRDGARGSILFAGGRGDFIEKYSESYWDWRDRGYGLATFDWRGQGRSGRLGDDADKGHSHGFEPLLADFAEVVRWFRTELPAPHHLVAHSMGAHLALRHLALGGRDFERAVLLAPMLGIATRPVAPWLMRLILQAQRRAGRLGEYTPGGGPYRGREAGSPRQLLLTTDSQRYVDEPWWAANHPGLAVGAVTWGWLAAAHASLDAIAVAGRLQAVATPTLILLAEHEALVDNAATRRFAPRIPGAVLETVPDAAHELLREQDAIRARVLDRIDAWFA